MKQTFNIVFSDLEHAVFIARRTNIARYVNGSGVRQRPERVTIPLDGKDAFESHVNSWIAEAQSFHNPDRHATHKLQLVTRHQEPEDNEEMDAQEGLLKVFHGQYRLVDLEGIPIPNSEQHLDIFVQSDQLIESSRCPSPVQEPVIVWDEKPKPEEID